MNPKRELIRWVDSHSGGGAWQETSRLRDEMPVTIIETIGWVMHDEPDRLIVAGSHTADWELVGEVMSIVKVAVLSREAA